ncbi:MAG: sialate O-acetylesterase, partial [Verrucomicrobiota bacterium]
RHYRHKMEALASGWRNRWANPDLPFYFVQLPSYPNATGWIRVREEQRRALSIPNSGMVTTIDIRGEGIHPPNKMAIGERLAKLALTKSEDGGNAIGSGPHYRGHQVVGWEVRVQFDHIGDGLFAGNKPGFGPPEETPDDPLRWFELAGADGVWKPAEARIEGDEVIVLCHDIPLPTAVRYACTTEPQGGNLYNSAGLPASPFCSNLDLLPWQDHQ